MLTRVKVALQAPDAPHRLAHFILGKVLFTLPVQLRRSIFAGRQYYCPVCDSQIRSFLVLYRPYHLWCPVCRSLQRQRLLWLYLAKSKVIVPDKPQRLLHFAPEPCLAERLSRMPGLDYVSADFQDPYAMVRIDITQIQFPDNSFDIILCSHVLEHVADDQQAMLELYRVLKPEGQAIIFVPITVDLTQEEAAITDPIQREKLFGRYDHVRRYGRDFESRLAKAGFKTSGISVEDIVQPDEIGRMGLARRETVFVGRKE